MGTFVNPTTDTSAISNSSLSGANRTWNQATETWDENINTWDNPYLPETNPTAHASVIANPQMN